MKLKLEGIWTPMVTPLKENSNIDLRATKDFVNRLVESGIDGLFPLGTTGEFALLTPQERNQVVKAVVDEANGRVPVIAGISDPSTENIVRFASEAKDAGVDGVITTTPFYYSTTQEGIYQHFRLLASKIDLPLILYNIPEWTHTFATPSVVGRLAREGLIAGLKYTEYNLLRLFEFIAEVQGRIPVLNGSDAMTFTNLEFGGSGAIMGVSNLAPKLSARLFDEFNRGNMKGARELQMKLLPFIQAMAVGQFPAGLKEAMNLSGCRVGGTKDPVPSLLPEEKKTVRAILARAGVPPSEF
ncbi:MAG: 4-hydroxy-tetrahydrodipicolinate synthase [Nitrososphaerales archaeon]